PPQPARLPAPQGRGALQGPDREARPASLSKTTAAAQRCAAVLFLAVVDAAARPGQGSWPVHRKSHRGHTQVAKVTKSFQYGNQTITVKTGTGTRQAGGAVMASCEGTVLLVTAVANKSAREGQDFFPLTVDYQEKFYAGGRIPGVFFKREGRQTEKETLISRLIDRPLRPLFPEEFRNEVQVIATVMSLNPEIDGDIAGLIGASAAVAPTGEPINGP